MNNWKLIPHVYQADSTGDYDNYYEITNDKISLITKDGDETSLQKIINAMNDSGCQFEIDNTIKNKLEYLKKENRRLLNLLQLNGIDPTGNNFHDI